ncbi:MAG: trimeric intracellular cation channel family protein [Chthoniobacterales bacterium]
MIFAVANPEVAAALPGLPVWLELTAMGVSGFFGGVLAASRNTPAFGIVIGGLVVGLGGGVIRDVMLNVMPAAIAQWYLIPAVGLAALLGGLCSGVIEKSRNSVVVLQALSLGLLVVIGCEKATDFHVSSWAVVAMGMITASAGGAMLDALSGMRAALLSQGHLHLTTLAAGAVAFVGLDHSMSTLAAEICTVALVVALRILSLRHGWSCPELPKAASTDS